MVDFRIADTAPEHEKLRAAGLAPAGLWALAGAYAMRELTDGWVPEYWVMTWVAGKRHATILVKVGLWCREERRGLPGYAFHDWTHHQRTAQSVIEDRTRARDRMAALRGAAPGKSPPRSRNVRPNKQRTFERTEAECSAEQTANVRPKFGDSLSRSGGDLGGERLVSNAGARGTQPPPPAPSSENRPAERCSEHRDLDTEPGPCRGCMKAREHAQDWDKNVIRQRIVDVRKCTWCDTEGWRIDPRHKHRGPFTPGVRCDHTPWSPEQLEASAS